MVRKVKQSFGTHVEISISQQRFDVRSHRLVAGFGQNSDCLLADLCRGMAQQTPDCGVCGPLPLHLEQAEGVKNFLGIGG